jgi:hypothetical protein
VDASRTTLAGQPAFSIDAQEAESRGTLGAVYVLDEHPRRGEEISGGLLEEHDPTMTARTSLTTFLSLI